MSLDEKIGKDRGIFNDVDVVRVLDLKESIKELKGFVDKNKLLESDFQSGEIEFSYTGELIPIEILNVIINEVFGRRLTGEERNG